jgi:hypothetical protein
MNFDDQLAKLQALTRTGSMREARAEIRELCSKPLKRRQHAVRLAFLARHAGMPEQALRLLHRVVRGEAKGRAPSEEEKAEYGMALAYFGAGREAISVLSSIDATQYPWALDGLVLAYFRQWDWSRALPLVVQFLGKPGISERDRLIHTYYLGRALLHGKDEIEAATRVFTRLVVDTAHLDYGILYQDSLLALADCHYLGKRWKPALAVLSRLAPVLEGAPDSPQAMSALQLGAEIALRASGGTNRAALARLRDVRAQWAAAHRWERVRSCDFQQALATQDEKLLCHLYFGTPYPAARAKFLREFGWSDERLPSHYDWSVGSGVHRSASRSRKFLDLQSGLSGDEALFKPGQLNLRTIGALAGDFYFPPTIATLHELLHPGQVLHPVAGPARVRQALKSVRGALLRQGLPLRIEESRRRYFLASASPFVIRVSQGGGEKSAGLLERARRAFGAREFSSAELARSEGVSERTARRFLKEALAQGWVQMRRGSGGEIFYRI